MMTHRELACGARFFCHDNLVKTKVVIMRKTAWLMFVMLLSPSLFANPSQTMREVQHPHGRLNLLMAPFPNNKRFGKIITGQ